jgi:hypothetical protein
VLTFISALSSLQTSLIVSELQTRKAEERMDVQSFESPAILDHKYLNPALNHSHARRPGANYSDKAIFPWENTNFVLKFTYQAEEIQISPNETDRSQ